jgi:Protein of unknown function (DUF4065)
MAATADMIRFDERKLKELVIYVCQKAEDDASFGKIKLLKLLAYSDFLSFKRKGAPITGATYIKLEHGPAPKELPGALEVLVAKKDVEPISENAYGYQQTRYVANREAATDLFDSDDLALVDQVVAHFWGVSNSDMSHQSHLDFAGWNVVEEMEPFPYSSVFLTTYASDRDVERGKELAAANGW